MNENKNRPYIIGITGTIGSGKSTIGSILEAMGVPVVDTDRIVHDLFESDESLVRAIKVRFGQNVLKLQNGKERIDRGALGTIVFSDEKARRDLESLVHPLTIEACEQRIKALSEHKLIAVLVPLLFEAGLEKYYDEIWTVHVSDSVLKERLKLRDQLTDEEADKRLAAQLSQAEKMARSHCLIDNSGSRQDTEEQVKRLVHRINEAAEKSSDAVQ